MLSDKGKFEILKIVGDYKELSVLLSQRLQVEGTADSILDELRIKYKRLKSQGKFLVILVDEFGKVLEHAARNNPERELYFTSNPQLPPSTSFLRVHVLSY